MFVPFLGFNPHSWVSTILLVVQDFAGHPQYHYQSNLPFSNTCHGKDGHMPLIGHPIHRLLQVNTPHRCGFLVKKPVFGISHGFPRFLWMSEDF
jgi:hypothetical protein